MHRRKALGALAAAATAALAGAPAFAQSGPFPNRPIRIVAPFPPGGTADLVARTLAAALQENMKQTVVVENRPGAGGALGATVVSKSAPDGYTLFVGSTSTHAVNPHLSKSLGYDAERDFTPISMLVQVPSYLVVNPKVPASNVAELLKHLRDQPGRLSYGSAGNGTSQHTNVELFKTMSATSVVHVPYKGSAPAVQDLLGGQIDLMIELGPSVLPHVQSGKLRVLGVSTAQRQPQMPNVPTIAEAGVAGFEAFTWFALYAPAGVPAAITQQLQEETVKAFAQPEVRARLAAAGANASTTTSAQLAEFQRRESRKWREVVERAQIRLD